MSAGHDPVSEAIDQATATARETGCAYCAALVALAPYDSTPSMVIFNAILDHFNGGRADHEAVLLRQSDDDETPPEAIKPARPTYQP